MKIRTATRFGFTLVEIMIVVAIIGLLAAIAIPNFVKARTTAQKNACIGNLRQIDGAKQQWAVEMKQASSAVPAESDIAPYMGRNPNATTIKSACPAGGAGASFGSSYEINNLTAAPTCKIDTTHQLEN